jgi:hypothetical protein
MAYTTVIVQWRQGINGDQGTYTFSPNPVITRPTPGKRTASFVVPLLDGIILQSFSNDQQVIELAGVLFNKSHSWDEMETARNNMITLLGTGPGQLHIISPQRHILYSAQMSTEGIQWAEQARANLQDYTIRFVVPSGRSTSVIETSRNINSGAEII